MIEPGINVLMKRAESRYSLVVAVAKRARELSVEGAKSLVDVIDCEKAVSVAILEIAEGVIRIISAEDEPTTEGEIVYTDYIETSEEDGEEQ